MAFIPAVLSGVSALAGLFGGQKKTPETTNHSTTNSTGSTDYSNFNTPVLSDNQNQLADTFTRAALDKFRAGAGDTSGYEAGGLKAINTQGDLRNKLVSNDLAKRGLSYSPAATAIQSSAENERLGQQTNFLDTIPAYQRGIETDNFNNLLKSFGVLPTATSQTGSQDSTQSSTTDQRGTQIIPGNPAAGFFGGLGAGLASPNGQPGGGNNLSSILKSLGIGGN